MMLSEVEEWKGLPDVGVVVILLKKPFNMCFLEHPSLIGPGPIFLILEV